MVSKTQKKILLFYYKHQEKFIDINEFPKIKRQFDPTIISSLVEKEYLEALPDMSIEMKDGHMTLSTPDQYKITDTGIDIAELIKQNRTNRITSSIEVIGNTIGTIGGILGIISFFSA